MDGDDQLELPTEALRVAAFEQLSETKELRSTRLLELKAALACSSRFPSDNAATLGSLVNDDLGLLRFLRGRKFNVDKTVKTLLHRSAFQKSHPDWFVPLPDEVIGDVFGSFCHVLEQRDKLGRVVVVIRPSTVVPKMTAEFISKHPSALIRFQIWFTSRLSESIDVQVYGLIIVNCFTGLSVFTQPPGNAAERNGFFEYISNCCSFRVKGILVFCSVSSLSPLIRLSSSCICLV